MAASDIRRFHFYDQYIWQAQDFDNYQLWSDSIVAALAEGMSGAGILSGFGVTPNGGLNLQVAAGIASNASGRVIILPTPAVLAVPADGSNPSRHLIVARPVDTDMTDIPQPTNPINDVPLHRKQTYALVVISGTPAATPQYPSAQADDVVLMGVRVATAQATLTQADMDRSKIDLPRKKVKPIREVAANYSAVPTDEIIEVAATGGAVVIVLPTAVLCPGLTMTVLKTDSSANQVSASGQGGETISGQAVQVIDDQWGSVSMYSNGLGWRVI